MTNNYRTALPSLAVFLLVGMVLLHFVGVRQAAIEAGTRPRNRRDGAARGKS